MQLGSKIKELRKSQNITLVELSEKSGVQIATLSRMENLKMTGTLESHIAIARALGVDITQLYAGISNPGERIDHKSGNTQADVFVHTDKSSYEILVSKIKSKKMMPILLKIETGGHTNREENAIGTERFVFVLDGKVEAQISGQKYTLNKNNSLYFDASLPHSFTNIGKAQARLVSVITPAAL